MRLEERRQLAIASRYIDTFFDVYLRGEPVSKLNENRPYPEVECVR